MNAKKTRKNWKAEDSRFNDGANRTRRALLRAQEDRVERQAKRRAVMPNFAFA